ncbi:TauD/TfdA family dioxygenase [Leptospira sp. 2 VSF19]|uniref:TauD/TfdA family dioxygenase n=1 Tax=Leptospira soteropolitanensis TaxID=2950025 RepID=A0AAW5VPW2_9LEPT|nr:TauD/TfdA family dioxygenase [Leptospira soteropolitanensis]MCW7494508.1 TauD/TfdA family dioxygenase [Leptospira soteropolitanensis]MCW7502102.1 TauD/TfdA family dioxygenase [Leptospira soteropolitanensis]MCW7524354.1 TauD/TfdA family dioxygenase [Leptospira soteropolitanensis]MCW7528220.1 TauD/TfdA family dioxygenase [Leptospira soteropolitanensis]MCW7532072.1 TauD/TfdA family dioxygenase [Leptospira soteropolitanensis]
MTQSTATQTKWIRKSFIGETKLPVVYEPKEEREVQDLFDWVRQNQKEWREDLKTYGAILFRGFPIHEATDFQSILFATGEKKLGEFYLGTSPRDQVVKHVFTASELPPHYPIMQHAEMSFLDHPPKLLFFYAEKASETGGETPLTDLREIYKEINPKIREKIEKHGIRYRRRYDGPSKKARFSLWKTKRWDEMFGTTDLEEVKKISKQNRFHLDWFGKDSLTITNEQSGFRIHPETKTIAWHNHSQTFHYQAAVSEVWKIFKKQKTIRSLGVALLLTLLTTIKRISGSESHDVHVTYGNGEEISAKEMKSISDVFWKHLVAIPWQTGDVLIIDNLSVSHGRLPFTGPRRILVGWSD